MGPAVKARLLVWSKVSAHIFSSLNRRVNRASVFLSTLHPKSSVVLWGLFPCSMYSLSDTMDAVQASRQI